MHFLGNPQKRSYFALASHNSLLWFQFFFFFQFEEYLIENKCSDKRETFTFFFFFFFYINDRKIYVTSLPSTPQLCGNIGNACIRHLWVKDERISKRNAVQMFHHRESAVKEYLLSATGQVGSHQNFLPASFITRYLNSTPALDQKILSGKMTTAPPHLLPPTEQRRSSIGGIYWLMHRACHKRHPSRWLPHNSLWASSTRKQSETECLHHLVYGAISELQLILLGQFRTTIFSSLS